MVYGYISLVPKYFYKVAHFKIQVRTLSCCARVDISWNKYSNVKNNYTAEYMPSWKEDSSEDEQLASHQPKQGTLTLDGKHLCQPNLGFRCVLVCTSFFRVKANCCTLPFVYLYRKLIIVISCIVVDVALGDGGAIASADRPLIKAAIKNRANVE